MDKFMVGNCACGKWDKTVKGRFHTPRAYRFKKAVTLLFRVLCPILDHLKGLFREKQRDGSGIGIRSSKAEGMYPILPQCVFQARRRRTGAYIGNAIR